MNALCARDELIVDPKVLLTPRGNLGGFNHITQIGCTMPLPRCQVAKSPCVGAPRSPLNEAMDPGASLLRTRDDFY
ncbi:MAG: hypothetical protein AAGA68_18830 [Pseudomonadota bacterium]